MNAIAPPPSDLPVWLVAHEPLASALLAVARHAYPDGARRLTAIDVGPAEAPEAIEARLQRLWGEQGQPPMLILTDVAGATPHNAAQHWTAQHAPSRLVAGVNVPMLWRVLCYGHTQAPEAAECALAGGARGVAAGSHPFDSCSA